MFDQCLGNIAAKLPYANLSLPYPVFVEFDNHYVLADLLAYGTT